MPSDTHSNTERHWLRRMCVVCHFIYYVLNRTSHRGYLAHKVSIYLMCHFNCSNRPDQTTPLRVLLLLLRQCYCYSLLIGGSFYSNTLIEVLLFFSSAASFSISSPVSTLPLLSLSFFTQSSSFETINSQT